MKVSVVTDEISSDLETALELAGRWQVDGVELRGIGTDRYPRVSKYWKARVPELIAESGLPVAAISSGLFKIPYPEPPADHTRNLRWEDAAKFRQHRQAFEQVMDHSGDLLAETLDAARTLGAESIICFSFDRGPGVPSGNPPLQVVEILREAARRAEEADIRLAVEVEHICWADTGESAARLLEAVDHPNLWINWDPANTYLSGDDVPYPDGFRAIADRVGHVHFKDAASDSVTGRRHFAAEGVVDWEGQIDALAKAGYDGWITIETHGRPKVQRTEEALGRLRQLLGVDR